METNNNDEAFNLDSLPRLLQQMIIEEVDMPTFTELGPCSLKTNEMCSTRKSPISIDIHYLHVYQRRTFVVRYEKIEAEIRKSGEIINQKRRTKSLTRLASKGYQVRCEEMVLKCSLTSKVCRRLIGQIERLGTTIGCFEFPLFRHSVNCSLDEFNTLIEVSKCERICSVQFISKDYFRLPAIQKVSSIHIHENDMSDFEFLGLRAKNLTMKADTVSDTAIIQYIQECSSGTRSYEFFNLILKFERLNPIMEALGAELVLTPASVWGNKLSRIPRENLEWIYRVPSETHEDGYIRITLCGSGRLESTYNTSKHRKNEYSEHVPS